MCGRLPSPRSSLDWDAAWRWVGNRIGEPSGWNLSITLWCSRFSQVSKFAEKASLRCSWAQVRYIVYQERLWRIGAQAFNAAVPAGLPAVASAAQAGKDTAACWEALADALETFLLGADTLVAVASAQPGGRELPLHRAAARYDGSLLLAPDTRGSRSGSQWEEATDTSAHQPEHDSGISTAAVAPLGLPALAGAAAPAPFSPQQARADAELEVAVLDCLADAVLTQCAATSVVMKQRLINIVDRGASRPKQLSVPQVQQFIVVGVN